MLGVMGIPNVTQSKEMLPTAIDECAALRASLINRADKTTADDAIAIATAFALEAANIYRALGGEKMVAAQFYILADAATNKL